MALMSKKACATLRQSREVSNFSFLSGIVQRGKLPSTREYRLRGGTWNATPGQEIFERRSDN